jgi:hypothetical protein
VAETPDELIQRGKAELRGTWPEGCLQRAFVDGARWWEFYKTGASMWQSDRHLAEAEAVKMYGIPTNPPNRNEYLLELIDILARPIQDGGEGMADNQDSPLMRLREKIVSRGSDSPVPK